MSELKVSYQCHECGMMVEVDEYHPYAACLMFKGCHNSVTVRINLEAVRKSGMAGLNPEAIPKVVEALEQILGWRELRSGMDPPMDRVEEIAVNALREIKHVE